MFGFLKTYLSRISFSRSRLVFFGLVNGFNLRGRLLNKYQFSSVQSKVQEVQVQWWLSGCNLQVHISTCSNKTLPSIQCIISSDYIVWQLMMPYYYQFSLIISINLQAWSTHTWTQLNDLAPHKFLQLSGYIACLVFGRSWARFLSGLRFFFVPCSRHVD